MTGQGCIVVPMPVLDDRFPDYTCVREDPPTPQPGLRPQLSERVGDPRSPLAGNLATAMEKGGWHRLAIFRNKSTANSVASMLRRGGRRLPGGSEPDEWEFVIYRRPTKGSHESYGVWGRYLPHPLSRD